MRALLLRTKRMKFSESQEAIFRSRLQTIISPDCPARSDSRSVFKSDFGERESRSEFRVRSAPYPGQWPANKPADATQLQEAGLARGLMLTLLKLHINRVWLRRCRCEVSKGARVRKRVDGRCSLGIQTVYPLPPSTDSVN